MAAKGGGGDDILYRVHPSSSNRSLCNFDLRASEPTVQSQCTVGCVALADIFLIIMFGRTRPKISYTCSSRRAPHRGCAIVRAPARGCRARVMPCATRARPPVRWKMRRSPAPAQGARPRRRAAVRRYVVCKPTTSTVAPVATAR